MIVVILHHETGDTLAAVISTTYLQEAYTEIPANGRLHPDIEGNPDLRQDLITLLETWLTKSEYGL